MTYKVAPNETNKKPHNETHVDQILAGLHSADLDDETTQSQIRLRMRSLLDLKDIRIMELMHMVRTADAILAAISTAAGFKKGDQFTAEKVIKQLREQTIGT